MKVGDRVLLRDSISSYANAYACVVKEISPSGEWARFARPSGNEYWAYLGKIYIIEQLDPPDKAEEPE